MLTGGGTMDEAGQTGRGGQPGAGARTRLPPDRFLKAFYGVTLGVILLATLLTPFLVEGMSLVRREHAEVLLLAILLAAATVTRRLYVREAERVRRHMAALEAGRRSLEERLDEAFRYIGAVNVQVQEIESILTSIQKYPETRQESRRTLQFLTEKTLGLVDADWVLLRIVDRAKLRTLSEHWVARGQKTATRPSISNRDLVGRSTPDAFSVVESTQDSFSINTYCILPTSVDRRQRTLVEAIANQAEMLFLLFSSQYYQARGGTSPRAGEAEAAPSRPR